MPKIEKGDTGSIELLCAVRASASCSTLPAHLRWIMQFACGARVK